ncbi:MAG: hypothetical protein JOZ69_04555, partial [Myxococcales bacterium]|nr:hypothetical protein [Myxococcales bacterium]
MLPRRMGKLGTLVATLGACASCTSPPASPAVHPDALSVRVVTDIRYSTGADDGTGKDRLDLYLPEGGKAPFPVVVSFHGGALMQGDKSEQAFVGQAFAARGIGAAIVNYHLSPQVTHPRHVQDAAA